MEKSYKTADGAVISTSGKTAEALIEFERLDSNVRRKAHWRNEASIEQRYEETGWEPTDHTVNVEADYIAKNEKETLTAAIAGLSEKQRQVVRLYYYEQKTIPQIAKELGVKKQSVHECLEWALKKLRKYF